MILSISQSIQPGQHGSKVTTIGFPQAIEEFLDGYLARFGFVEFYREFHDFSTSKMMYVVDYQILHPRFKIVHTAPCACDLVFARRAHDRSQGFQPLALNPWWRNPKALQPPGRADEPHRNISFTSNSISF